MSLVFCSRLLFKPDYTNNSSNEKSLYRQIYSILNNTYILVFYILSVIRTLILPWSKFHKPFQNNVWQNLNKKKVCWNKIFLAFRRHKSVDKGPRTLDVDCTVTKGHLSEATTLKKKLAANVSSRCGLADVPVKFSYRGTAGRVALTWLSPLTSRRRRNSSTGRTCVSDYSRHFSPNRQII